MKLVDWRVMRMDTQIALVNGLSTHINKIGCVNKFICPCSGETKTQLINRVKEHNTQSEKSVLHEHIGELPNYSLKQAGELGWSPNRQQMLEFILSHVKNIVTDITYYHNRTDLEAMIVTVLKPKVMNKSFTKEFLLYNSDEPLTRPIKVSILVTRVHTQINKFHQF